MEFGQKKNHEIDLFDFMSFFGLDFFKFSSPLWTLRMLFLKELKLDTNTSVMSNFQPSASDSQVPNN